MAEAIVCKICRQRRAKRACPAVAGDICSVCCGTEREVTLSCPLECTYLREAHKREKPVAVIGSDLPDADVVVTEEFLREREDLFLFCIFSLVRSAAQTPGAVDSDVRDALASLIKTLRTAESGLVYETRSANALAAGIQSRFSEYLTAYQREPQKSEVVTRSGSGRVKDSDLLAILVLLRRIAGQNNNGRPRGRMFLDVLSQMTPRIGVDERAPSIIL